MNGKEEEEEEEEARMNRSTHGKNASAWFERERKQESESAKYWKSKD